MIQAKINGKWGALPESMVIPMPPAGTAKAFEFTYFFKDPTGKKQWKNMESLTSIVKVINPDTKSQIEIGLVGGVDLNGNARAEEIRRVWFSPQQTAGLHHIVIGDSGDADELYQFMMMTSENADSKFRDGNTPAIFTVKDYNAEAKKNLEARRDRREALSHAINLKDVAIEKTAFLLGIPVNADAEILLDAIVASAEKDPKNYFDKVHDKDADAKAALAQALHLEIVKIDEDGGRLAWSNDALILDLVQTGKEQAANEFAEYIRSDDKAKIVLDKIVKQIAVITKANEAKAKVK